MNQKNTDEKNDRNLNVKNAIGLKDLLPFAFRLGERTLTYWAFNTTVNIAIIGWMISNHGEIIETKLRIAATIGVCLFSIIMSLTFWDAYEHIRMMIADIEKLSEISELPEIKGGYIYYLMNTKYTRSKCRSVLICSSFSVLLIILIWVPWLMKYKG